MFLLQKTDSCTTGIWVGHKTWRTKGTTNISAAPCTPAHTNPSTYQTIPLNFVGPFMKLNHPNLGDSGYFWEYGPVFIKDSSVRLLWSYCKAAFWLIAWIQWPMGSGSRFRGSEASKFFLPFICKTWYMACFACDDPLYLAGKEKKIQSLSSKAFKQEEPGNHCKTIKTNKHHHPPPPPPQDSPTLKQGKVYAQIQAFFKKYYLGKKKWKFRSTFGFTQMISIGATILFPLYTGLLMMC